MKETQLERKTKTQTCYMKSIDKYPIVPTGTSIGH